MKVRKDLLVLAKAQRKTKNPWEAKLWKLLRAKGVRGFKFKRQVPVGSYIVDFCCRKPKLVIEIDGGQHNDPKNIKSDKARSDYLKNEGYKILRFWNNEVQENIDGIFQTILKNLQSI